MVLFNICFKKRDEANKRSLALHDEELFRCSFAVVALRLLGATPRSYINPYQPSSSTHKKRYYSLIDERN